MELISSTQEIIIKLKAVKEARNLSIAQIKSAVESSGGIVSETTLRRVFAPHSETDDSFSYDNTLKPIATAILLTENDNSETEADRKAFMAIAKYKDALIEELERKIVTLREHYEQRCAEYEMRMKFLRNQIELKDRRMDRKDKQIEQLLNKILKNIE